jgi:hypothetical protein
MLVVVVVVVIYGSLHDSYMNQFQVNQVSDIRCMMTESDAAKL